MNGEKNSHSHDDDEAVPAFNRLNYTRARNTLAQDPVPSSTNDNRPKWEGREWDG